MPMRSLSSSVLRWPDRDDVLGAARAYADLLVRSDSTVRRVGIFGSYGRGEVGPGSDADIIVEVDSSALPPERRVLNLPAPRLPVPVDLIVVTTAEIDELRRRSAKWSREVFERTVWLAERPSPVSA